MAHRTTGQLPPKPVLSPAERKQPSDPANSSMPVMRQSPVKYPYFVVQKIPEYRSQVFENITVSDLQELKSLIGAKLDIPTDESIQLIYLGRPLTKLLDPADIPRATVLHVISRSDNH